MEIRLYKRDVSGNVRVWTMELDKPSAQYRTHAGIRGGECVVSAWTQAKPNTLRGAPEQAEFEANAEIKKKLERDYHLTPDTIDQPRYFKPMLAHKYEAFPGRCFSQPKLDGIRCIARSDGLWSRNGKPILGSPHVFEALKPYFDSDPDLIFDGELYNHELKENFNQIVSCVKKQKPTKDDLLLSALHIEYHIYDLPSEEGAFGIRHEQLSTWLVTSGFLKPVPTLHCWNESAIDDAFAGYIEQGYEGQIIRLDRPYEQKRSKHLLKRKEFQDQEFPVLRVEEGIGNWAGYAKRVVLQLPDGREFGAGIKGNQDFTKQLLTQNLAGHHATVRFFNYTPDGIPRFPVAVDFHPEGGRL